MSDHELKLPDGWAITDTSTLTVPHGQNVAIASAGNGLRAGSSLSGYASSTSFQISKEDAATYFKALRPSLRERFIEDTEYVEARQMLAGDSVYRSMLAAPSLPTRFSSDELKRFHMDALIDEELKK
jgi:hypothetical protein